MRKRNSVVIVIGIVLVVGGWMYWHAKRTQSAKMAAMAEPVATVTTETTQWRAWQSQLTAVGTLRAIQGVDISSQVAGEIKDVYFTPGQVVAAGDVLLELDSDVEQAQLANGQAALKLAELSYQRQALLYKRANTARAELDVKQAELQEAKARVQELLAVIARKTMRAPFAGTLGIAYLTQGQYVTPGIALVSLEALDELYVDFTLPEQYLQQVSVGQVLQVNSVAAQPMMQQGKIVGINVKADLETHNIKIRGQIPNLQHEFLPGMAVNVAILLPTQDQVISLPTTAIVYSLHGDSVYVVEPDKDNPQQLRVQSRYVTVGEQQADRVLITHGLTAGQEVVTSGQIKLHPRSAVTIDNQQRLP